MTDTTTAYFGVQDQLADWECGHLLAELRTGRFTGRAYEVVTVAEHAGEVTTMGGVTLVAERAIADVMPEPGDLLILGGAPGWDAGGGREFTELAERFLDADASVAAICGATSGLARDGLLDDRDHTSAAAGYLAATGYSGGENYVEARAVVGDRVVTAGPDSPVQFAAATLRMLGLAEDATLDAYERVFSDSDASAYPTLMGAAA